MTHDFWQTAPSDLDLPTLRDTDSIVTHDLWDFDLDDVGTGWLHEAIPQVGSAAIDGLIANLDSPFSNVAYTAAEVLGMANDKRAIKPLLAHVEHPDVIVRYKVVGALILLGGRPLVERLLPVLLETLDSRHAIIRALTVEALGHSADLRAVAPLIAHLQSDWDGQVRAFAARGLGEIGHALAAEERPESQNAVALCVTHLVAALDAADARVHAAVCDGLTLLGTTAVGPLLARLADLADVSDEERVAVQVGAIRVLGKSGAPEAWPPLIELVADPAPVVRYHSAKALVRIDAARAMDSLVALVRADADADVRAHAIRLVGQATTADAVSAAQAVQCALSDTHGRVRLGAMRVVAQLATADADVWRLPYAVLLFAGLADEYSKVRAAACGAFGNPHFLARHYDSLSLEHVSDLLLGLLHDSSARVRSAAAAALAQVSLIRRATTVGALLPSGVVAALLAGVADESQQVCDAAANALGLLAPLLLPDERRTVTDTLIGRISNVQQGILHHSGTVWALGQFGDPRAIEALIALFDDPDWLLHEPIIHAVLKIDAAQALVELGRRLRADKPAGLRNAIGVALAQIKDVRTLPLLWRVHELMLEDEQMLQRDGSGPLRFGSQPATDERLFHRTASGEPFARHIIEQAIRSLEVRALG